MRILFLVRSLGVGGAERQAVVLARGLARRGHVVTIACFYGGGGLEAELEGSRVRVVQLDKRNRWDFVRVIRSFVRLLDTERPDVLHGYLLVQNVSCTLLSGWSHRARIVWGIRASDVKLEYEGFTVRVIFQLSRILSHFTDLIIANSRTGAASHIGIGYPRKKIVVVPNGIDTDRFKPDPMSGARVRAEWGVTLDVVLVGVVGRLDPIKGHDLFLRALSILTLKHPEVRAVFVGGGTDERRATLRCLAQDLEIGPALIWAGNRHDMNSVYNALDIVCSPSTSEGFPNVLGEALACGVPCVATDVGDSAFLLGSLGVVVPSGDDNALAGGLGTMITARSPELGSLCRQRVVQHFSVDVLVTATESLLRD